MHLRPSGMDDGGGRSSSSLVRDMFGDTHLGDIVNPRKFNSSVTNLDFVGFSRNPFLMILSNTSSSVFMWSSKV